MPSTGSRNETSMMMRTMVTSQPNLSASPPATPPAMRAGPRRSGIDRIELKNLSMFGLLVFRGGSLVVGVGRGRKLVIPVAALHGRGDAGNDHHDTCQGDE